MEDEFGFARNLVELATLIMRMVKDEHRAAPGTPSLTQYRILHQISKGVRHVGKLARAFGISQPATSIMVNTMVKEGLISRKPHPDDRRQIELHLTPKAKKNLETIRNRALKKIDSRFSSLTQAQKKLIAQQIQEILAIFSTGSR